MSTHLRLKTLHLLGSSEYDYRRGIVSCFLCHSHSDLCNVYPVALKELKGKHYRDHYDYDMENKIQSQFFKLNCKKT